MILAKNSQKLTRSQITWDGYTNAAALAPEGTYFYVISYLSNKEEYYEKGSITLLR